MQMAQIANYRDERKKEIENEIERERTSIVGTYLLSGLALVTEISGIIGILYGLGAEERE